MDACMNACMYVCMYACMYVCMHAFMHACMYVCLFVCMYDVCMYVCMYVCVYLGIQSAGDLVSKTLVSNPAFSREAQLVPLDSKIACLCQSIGINNNKDIYRQSQVRKPTTSWVEWAGSLVIGTGCRVQNFSLIFDSSVGLSAGVRSAGDLVSDTLGSNLSIWISPVPEHRN